MCLGHPVLGAHHMYPSLVAHYTRVPLFDIGLFKLWSVCFDKCLFRFLFWHYTCVSLLTKASFDAEVSVLTSLFRHWSLCIYMYLCIRTHVSVYRPLTCICPLTCISVYVHMSLCTGSSYVHMSNLVPMSQVTHCSLISSMSLYTYTCLCMRTYVSLYRMYIRLTWYLGLMWHCYGHCSLVISSTCLCIHTHVSVYLHRSLCIGSWYVSLGTYVSCHTAASVDTSLVTLFALHASLTRVYLCLFWHCSLVITRSFSGDTFLFTFLFWNWST